jgi:hypothetical protein
MMEKKMIESLGFHRDGKILIIDDNVEIPDEIKNMSHEERQRRILLLEEQGREEGKNLPDPKPLLAIQA